MLVGGGIQWEFLIGLTFSNEKKVSLSGFELFVIIVGFLKLVVSLFMGCMAFEG